MGAEIPKLEILQDKVFGSHNEKQFAEIALDVFRYQFLTNEVYQHFCSALGRNPKNVHQPEEIPFLPIQFFKNREVKSGDFEPETVFTSSGTTGASTSRHFVKELAVYHQSFANCFRLFYGKVQDACILGLLPSYLERTGSSLVYMVDALIKESGDDRSGFYLNNYEALQQKLLQLETNGRTTILFGVTYALLDFAEKFPLPLRHTTIIETGGMKGRKQEMSKPELYAVLRKAFSTDEIHAEYGMTELLSQAYAVNGFYKTPPWMKIFLRDETDPLSLGKNTGAINVIDLANLHSCSFIATDDLGRMHADGRFEVLGRMDNADIRGCSQLVL